MRARLFSIILVIIKVLFIPDSAIGQSAPEKRDTIRINAMNVFLDCRSCDMNYIREELPYINYVRDVGEAQVYILDYRPEFR